MVKELKQVSIIPIGGVGDVTRNMYLYEYKDEILIVDCGLGFADETMLGIDLLLPDIKYLLQTNKKIMGMCISHGHEDHMGGLPFLLSSLLSKNPFPLYASPLTAAFANRKLKEFSVSTLVQPIQFENPQVVMGSFKVDFIRVTHSVPDTSHLFIQTPIGNFYHGSDFKFDDTPWDGKISNYQKIQDGRKKGILCLLSDCLGTERFGKSLSEMPIYDSFEKIMSNATGRVIITTYSSHVGRLNQIVQAAIKTKRKICFVGRSLTEAKDNARRLGYMVFDNNMEVPIDQLKSIIDKELVLIVAGSQGQENSAMARIVSGDRKEIKLTKDDTVVFSSDPIPGNELLVNALIDAIYRKGATVFYPRIHDFLHVSGHGYREDLKKLIRLTNPRKMIPIGGNYRHMALYKEMVSEVGRSKKDVLLLEDGQEVIFNPTGVKFGRKIPVRHVFVDEITGEELESYVLRDRQKLSESGVIIVMVEVDSENGQLVNPPDILARGFILENKKVVKRLEKELTKIFSKKRGFVTNWGYTRKLVGEVSERIVFQELRRRPLVLPIVVEV